MGTRFVRTGHFFQTSSTRYLLVPTTTITQVFLTTGYTAMRIYNFGSNSLVWGDTGVVTNSGNFLFPYVGYDFGEVQDNFNFGIIADSANSFIAITEYIK